MAFHSEFITRAAPATGMGIKGVERMGFGFSRCEKLQTLLAENQHENKVLYLLFKVVVCNSASVDCDGKLNRFHKPASRSIGQHGWHIKVLLMKCSL